jgi:hypothetical protein
LIYEWLIYLSTRDESGNAISKEKPSLVAGAVGGRGSANRPCPEPGVADAALASLSRADLVWLPMGSIVTAGGCQARLDFSTVPLDLAGCINGLRTITPPCRSMRSDFAWQGYGKATAACGLLSDVYRPRTAIDARTQANAAMRCRIRVNREKKKCHFGGLV